MVPMTKAKSAFLNRNSIKAKAYPPMEQNSSVSAVDAKATYTLQPRLRQKGRRVVSILRFSKKGHWNIPFCKKPDRFAQAYITKIVNQIDVVSKCIRPEWSFLHQDYLTTIADAQAGDMIYCDPPYLGRYTDYFNTWTEENEARLANALHKTPARFVMSSWHHNDFRENKAIDKYWNDFNILTRDHFYHSGAKEENRRSIVEALICNFDLYGFESHNHGIRKKPEQLTLF